MFLTSNSQLRPSHFYNIPSLPPSSTKIKTNNHLAAVQSLNIITCLKLKVNKFLVGQGNSSNPSEIQRAMLTSTISRLKSENSKWSLSICNALCQHAILPTYLSPNRGSPVQNVEFKPVKVCLDHHIFSIQTVKNP